MSMLSPSLSRASKEDQQESTANIPKYVFFAEFSMIQLFIFSIRLPSFEFKKDAVLQLPKSTIETHDDDLLLLQDEEFFDQRRTGKT